MDCCSECFSSSHLKGIINSSSTLGNCDFCYSTNVYIYNPKELNLIFQNILDLYEINPEFGSLIETQIEKDFARKIFSAKVIHNQKTLLKEIVADDYTSYQELFENPVVLNCTNNPDNDDKIKPLQISWENFAHEIKSINRFHLLNALDLEKLELLLARYKKPIKKGKIFYRARISTKEGFPIEEMGNPPSDKTKPGRANPIGISYLYLADHLNTTLYEARASLLDFVTIAEFRLEEDITVINLRGNSYDPIVLADEGVLEDYLIHLPFISKLESTLSKPRRRDDNELDYLPTQYLSEYIKSIGFDGVEFKSSLFSEGYNLAIFNPGKFKCINVDVCEIKHIEFHHAMI